MVKNKVNQPKKDSNKKNRNKKNEFQVIRYQTYDTVRYDNKGKHYFETDNAFLNDIKNVVNSRHNLLTGILKFKKQELTDQQCNQIDFRGRLHYLANLVNQNSNRNSQDIGQFKCLCGCQKSKGKSLSLFVYPQNLNYLGSGVLLMFLFIKSLTACLLIATLVYGIFSLVTNLIGGDSHLNSQCTGDYCKFQNNGSDINKIAPDANMIIQWWLGLVFCIFWLIALRFIKYYGRQKNKFIDQKLNSAADTAIKITNLPYGQYSQEQLLQYFQRIWIRSQKQQNDSSQITQQKKNQQYFNQESKGNHFKMKELQVVYNVEFSRKMIDNIFSHCLILDTILKESEDETQKKIKNQIQIKQISRYRQMKSQIINNLQLLNDLRKKFLNDSDFRKSLSTSMCLVILRDQTCQQHMLQKFGKQKIGLITQMQQKLKTCLKLQSQSSLSFKGKYLIIERAPQPSDIIWRNCQKKYSLKRKLIIYGVTTLIILMSFAVITGLSYAQVYLAKQNSSATNDTSNSNILTIVNIVMSLALQIVNKVLWLILFYLLQIQYNFTLTQKIISQMNKSLFAISVNVIVLPIIINYYISFQIFGSKGLAGIVFDYQISLIGIGLIIKLLDPVQIIKRLLLYVRCTRNMILKFLCSNIQLDLQKLQLGIKQINQFYEGSYLDIAQTYVYIIAAIYQAAFFCQLQPFVLVISTAMCFLFYWVNKIKLLYVCKIPQITDKLVFQTAVTQASLIPIVYGVGSIIMSYIQKELYVNRPYQIYQSAIAIGIGLIGFFNPNDILNVFIVKVTKCFPFLQAKNIFKEEVHASEPIQKDNLNMSEMKIQQNQNINMKSKQKVQAQKKKEDQIQIKEDFYKESNGLDLLGFQNLLTDKLPSRQIVNQLQKFCTSFFPNEEPLIQQMLIKQFTQNIIKDQGGQNPLMKLIGNVKQQAK